MKTTSSRARLKKLAENIKNMSRAFTIVNTQLQILKEADSYISDSEDEDEASNFQMANINFGKSDFGFAQLDEECKPRISSLFNQTTGNNIGIKTKLNLREDILIYSQLTMDFFCNQDSVEKTAKSKTKLLLKSNGRTMTVSRQLTVNGYHNIVWFSETPSPISYP